MNANQRKMTTLLFYPTPVPKYLYVYVEDKTFTLFKRSHLSVFFVQQRLYYMNLWRWVIRGSK